MKPDPTNLKEGDNVEATCNADLEIATLNINKTDHNLTYYWYHPYIFSRTPPKNIRGTSHTSSSKDWNINNLSPAMHKGNYKCKWCITPRRIGKTQLKDVCSDNSSEVEIYIKRKYYFNFLVVSWT